MGLFLFDDAVLLRGRLHLDCSQLLSIHKDQYMARVFFDSAVDAGNALCCYFLLSEGKRGVWVFIKRGLYSFLDIKDTKLRARCSEIGLRYPRAVSIATKEQERSRPLVHRSKRASE